MKKLFWIPMVLALAVVILVILMEGGEVMLFVQLSAFLLTFGVTTILLLALFKPGEIGKSFSCALQNHSSSDPELKTALVFFETAQKLILGTGFLGTTLGIIFILADLGRPDEMGFGFAMSLMSVLYGIGMTVFITIPFAGAVRKKMAR